MADDIDFESFENMEDLDWSQMEDELKKTKDEVGAGATGMVEGGEMGSPAMGGGTAPMDINYLLDVNLEVTVEVGRRQAYISEILGYEQGAIMELDKAVGTPLDMLVNGKKVAKGVVVVMNERFAIKITEILDPHDRLAML